GVSRRLGAAPPAHHWLPIWDTQEILRCAGFPSQRVKCVAVKAAAVGVSKPKHPKQAKQNGIEVDGPVPITRTEPSITFTGCPAKSAAPSNVLCERRSSRPLDTPVVSSQTGARNITNDDHTKMGSQRFIDKAAIAPHHYGRHSPLVE